MIARIFWMLPMFVHTFYTNFTGGWSVTQRECKKCGWTHYAWVKLVQEQTHCDGCRRPKARWVWPKED